MLFLVLQEFLTLVDVPLYLLCNRCILETIGKLPMYLVTSLDLLNLPPLVQLINLILKHHHTLSAHFLRDHKLVPINLLIILIFFLLLGILGEV